MSQVQGLLGFATLWSFVNPSPEAHIVKMCSIPSAAQSLGPKENPWSLSSVEPDKIKFKKWDATCAITRASWVSGCCWATVSSYSESKTVCALPFQADTELQLIRRIPLPALIYTWWTCCCCFLLIREYCRFSALMSVVMRSIIMLLKVAWYSLRQELMAPGLSSAMLLDLRLCSSWGSVLAAIKTRRNVSRGELG